MKIRGVWQSESRYACSRSNGGGSIYYFPISSLISFWTDWVNLSGLIILNMISLLNLDIYEYFPGHFSEYGSTAL
jgi:hypothetical protein